MDDCHFLMNQRPLSENNIFPYVYIYIYIYIYIYVHIIFLPTQFDIEVLYSGKNFCNM